MKTFSAVIQNLIEGLRDGSITAGQPLVDFAGVNTVLACPFCGGKPRIDRVLRDGCKDGEPDAYAYYYRCLSCACQGPWTKGEVSALRLWNMRAKNKTRIKGKPLRDPSDLYPSGL